MPQMKYIMKSLFFFLLLIGNISHAQEVEKIMKSDFAMQSHPLDSLAGASYVFSKLEVEYKFTDRIELVIKYHDRIRIHNGEGKEYANYEIDLFSDDESEERLSYVKAIIYNLKDDKIIKSKLSRKKIINDEISDNHSITRFALAYADQDL